MRARTTSLLTALIAALTLGVMISSASAGNLSITNRNIRIVYTPITFIGAEGAVQIECNLTLEGSLHQTPSERWSTD